MEATGGLERATAQALCLAGYSVIVINPRQAHDFAKALGHLSKTDKTDAQALAQFAHTLHSSDRWDKLRVQLPTPEQDLLSALVTRRTQLVGMRVAEGGNRLAGCHRTQRKSIGAVLAVIDRQIKDIDKSIAGTLDQHFRGKVDLLTGMKGAGTGTQAALMACLPELGQLSGREIAKLVGVAPLNCDSGKAKGVRTTWGGRAAIRAALYMASLSAARFDPVIKAFCFMSACARRANRPMWRWWRACTSC